jgi:peptidoglycan/LPS O-acetylase OafA/YrhL
MIVFLWAIIPVFGGQGPRFYQMEEEHSCSESWFWHVLYLNNIIPWRQTSKCLQQTWYLANDMQFFVLLCILVGFYATQRKIFYYTTIFLSVAAITIQLIIINTNDLKASYLTYQDEYWTLYYYKPYTRIHGYLVGVWFGCIFYSYKHETPAPEIEAEGGEEDEEEEKEAKPA